MTTCINAARSSAARSVISLTCSFQMTRIIQGSPARRLRRRASDHYQRLVDRPRSNTAHRSSISLVASPGFNRTFACRTALSSVGRIARNRYDFTAFKHSQVLLGRACRGAFWLFQRRSRGGTARRQRFTDRQQYSEEGPDRQGADDRRGYAAANAATLQGASRGGQSLITPARARCRRVGAVDVVRHPVAAEQVPRHLDDDVVGFEQAVLQVVVVARQALQAARAARSGS